MKLLLKLNLIVLIFTCLVTIAYGKDPYPGSGGLFFGTPSDADVKSGRAVFDEEKFSAFKIGETSKSDVVEKLGKPDNWSTNEDGTSELGYNYVQKQPSQFRLVKEARFIFNKNYTLIKMQLPKFNN